ncbi:hypothetical protein Ocin01_16298 [Orchesella cincta]|uniref:Uncharacterized protein n=1 Tax=Orchesella cincta TaxID=48709 RepID=A0A1D2MBT7_ORCCI|nr:hypothetical protein Ocin01_16298 [Orchesella cincta]
MPCTYKCSCAKARPGESRPNEIDHLMLLFRLVRSHENLVPDKRLKQVVAAASRRSRRDSFDEADSEDPTQALVLRRGNDDEASALEGSGEACLFDYISKSRHNAVNAYEPRGDEFDLYKGLTDDFQVYGIRGYEGKRDLRSLMVVLPYTSSQSNAIVQLIRDHIVRGQSARTEYLNYVNYVLMRKHSLGFTLELTIFHLKMQKQKCVLERLRRRT